MDKVFLLLLPFYLFANSYSGVWLDLKSGKQVKIEDYDREVYTFYGKDLLEGKNGNIYRKLDISNNLFFGNVYSFLQQEPTTVSGAKITLTGKKQKEFKYITKTDNNGYFSIEGIRLGEYRIKIKKGNLSFFGDVTISGSNQQKRFYLAEEDSPKFHIKENYLPINTLETLDQKIPLEIANGSSTDKKVCLSLFFDKDKVKDHRLENRCLTIQSRQTEIFQLEILFNKNINSQKNFNMGIGIESEGFIFREVVQLGVNYQYNPLRFNGKNSVKVYILSSDGKITQLNRRKEIGFVEQIDEVYTLVLYSKRKLDRYEVDIGYDINISNKLSIRKRSTLPFSLKKSLESDFGYLKEYKFRSMESVFLNEDDGTYQKALNDNTIISSKLYDETLATISLKDGLLTISPRKNKSGSSVISFFAIDDEGKYKIKKELYLNILERNDKPVIMFEPKKEVKEGEFYSYKFQVFDVDNRKVVKKVISKPSWLNYNLKTGELSGVAEIGSRNYVELLVDDKKSIIKKSFFINVTGSKKNIKASKKVQKEPLIKKSSWQQIPKVEKIQLERHYFVLNSQSIVYSDKDKTSYAQKWPLNRLVAGSYDGQWIKVTKYLTSLGWNRVNGSRYIPIDNIQKDYFKYQTIKEVEVKSKAGKYLTKWPQGKIFFGRNKEGTIQVNKSFENGKWLTYKEVIKVSKESSKEIE